MDPITRQPDEMTGYLDFLMHRRRVESGNTLLQHFGLREDPFRVNPDARYLFPSKTHLEALTALETGFYNNRGFIAMIAPPGMGKTTLLYRFLEDTRDTARSTFIFDMDGECKPRDFVGYILRDFGISPAHSSSEMHKQLSEALVRETDAGRKCVVVIDEAQNLSDAVLERVRLLTNFETSQGKLLQIILSGQPQLTNKLMHASLVQLRQRVSTICRLNLLTADETRNYIDYRLRQSGYSGDPLFEDDALELIADLSNGTPRTINNLCFNTLLLCCAMQCKRVESGMVAKVAADMELKPRLKRSPWGRGAFGVEMLNAPGAWGRVRQTAVHWWHAAAGEVKVWVPVSVGVLIVAMLVIMRLGSWGDSQLHKTGVALVQNPVAAAPMSGPATSEKQANAAKQAPVEKQAAPRKSREKAAEAVASDRHSVPPTELARAVGSPAVQSGPVAPPAAIERSASAAASPKPGMAMLAISSNPPGADIEIDGAFVGNSPSTISVGVGSHLVSVGMIGYTGWSKTLTVTGGNIHLNAKLEPQLQAQ